MEGAALLILFLLLGLSFGGGDETDEDDTVEPDATLFDDFDGTDAQPDDGLIEGTTGNDLIFGGLFADGEQNTTDSGVAADSITAGDGSDTVFGGPGADTIEGGDDADSIDGGTGSDSILGGDGDDTLIAGDDDPGPNRLFGEGGNDLLISTENGFDTLVGGDDNDTLIGTGVDVQYEPGDGDDSVVAAANDNTVFTSRGDDTIDGSGGFVILSEDFTDPTDRVVDLLNGTVTATAAGFGTESVSGIDAVFMQGGNDTIIGDNDGNARLDGGLGNDSIVGGDGADRLDGDSDNDFLDGGAGADTIETGSGMDTVVAGENDTITDFDPSLDFIDLTGTYEFLEDARDDLVDGVFLSLNLTVDTSDADPLMRSELTTANTGLPLAITTANFIFDDFDGTTPQPDDGSINGTADRDVIFGGLESDGDVDTIDSGVPDDSITAGDSGDTVLGGPGDDTILGEGGNDSIDGGTGDDSVLGGEGDDTLISDDTSSTIFFDTLDGGAGNDLLTADGNDFVTLIGGEDDDTLIGNAQTNLFDPGPGNDSVLGGAEQNSVTLGSGDDTLTMVGSVDVLTVETAETADIAVDLLNGTVTGLGNTQISGFESVVTALGNDTIIGDNNGSFGLFGNGGNDSIVGGNGTEDINGGDDNDTIDGGGGADTITTGDGMDSIIAGENDRVTDFDPSRDVLDLTGLYTSLDEAKADLITIAATDARFVAINLRVQTSDGDALLASELTTANTGLA